MKITRFLIIFTFILCCLLAVCSCEKLPALNKPEKLQIEQATLILTWGEVKDARLYAISIEKEGQEPQEFIASKANYSLVSLTEGKYKIKVMARGKDGVSRDSQWSNEITFEREYEPGMTFALTSDKTGYTVTGKGNATGDIVIPDTYRGLPVVAIGDTAFFNKSDVTSITFGENSKVRSIGKLAFGNCSYLTSINLPATLEAIGDNAFASCRALAIDIVIPGGVKSISPNAFAYSAITGLTLHDEITSIGNYAFTDCKSLTKIVIPDSVKSIGEYAFSVCEGVSEITIGSGVEEIGKYAFSHCKALPSVVIPDSVKTLGEGAFYECAALAAVDLGDGITAIGAGSFNETKLWSDFATNEVYVGNWLLGLKDTKATTLDIVPGTVGIASYAFLNNRVFSDIRLPNSVKIIGEGAFAGSNIANFVLGSGVEIIGKEAFVSCTNLSAVILGTYDNVLNRIEFSSLKEIGNNAFQDCAALATIEIPTSVKKIGSYAFKNSGLVSRAGNDGVVYAGMPTYGALWVVTYNESLLGQIEIKDGTYGIANYAFYNCGTITDIVIPTSVKTIGRAAFYDCSELRTVELPATLEVIEDYTFYRCKTLKLVRLPESLKSIGRSAFYKCASTNYVTDYDTVNDSLVIPSSVEYIGDFAFYGCVYETSSLGNTERYGVENVIIGTGVQTIGSNAFYGMTSVKKVEMTAVKSIGEKAFYKCELLTEVNFGTALESIGTKAFYMCSRLESIHLPESLTVLSSYAFYKCSSLKDVSLGGVESIGDFAFYSSTSLKSVYLPESLTAIGRQAFRNCDELTAVMISSAIEKIDKHAFYGCDNLTVYTEFEAAPEGWNKYWNSSYRPVVYGCTLSEDKSYVLYMVKGTISNLNSSNSLSAPTKEGYTFVGWGNTATATEISFTSENLSEAEVGTKLYAIFNEE